MSNLEEKLISVGKIISTHGIKGELKIWINSDLSIKKDLLNKKIFLKDKSNSIEVYCVEKFYISNNKHILKLKDINNINTALTYKDWEVYFLKEDDLFELYTSLIDFHVLFENSSYGKVIDVMYNGAQDLVKVFNNDNQSIWVPCVDRFVEKVDYESKTITLKNIMELI